MCIYILIKKHIYLHIYSCQDTDQTTHPTYLTHGRSCLPALEGLWLLLEVHTQQPYPYRA